MQSIGKHPQGGSTPLERVEQTQRKVVELRGLLAKFRDAVDGQQISLRRLSEAQQSDQPQLEQDKAIRQMVTSLMLFEALGGQINTSFDEFQDPLVTLMNDVTQQLRDREQVAALAKSAEGLNSTLDLEGVLNQAMHMLVELTGAERAFLMLKDEESGEMNVRISHNIDLDEFEGSSFAISRTIVQSVVSSGEPVVTTNAAADPRFSDEESVALHSLRSIICVPIRMDKVVEGVIYADNRIQTDIFTSADRDFTATFANQAAAALENARLFNNVTLARNMMQNVFESIASAVIATDGRGRITLVNQAADEMLSADLGLLLKQRYAKLAMVFDGALTQVLDEIYSSGEGVERNLIEGALVGRGQVSISIQAAPLRNSDNEAIGAVMVIDDRTERVRFEHERGMVKRYLPSALVESFAEQDELHLGGTRREVSVLFADIRGFTSYSEHRDPGQVVDMINTYFGFASATIQAQNGIIDKYMGDAVMAHFNSPLLPVAEHARQAVLAAWEIRRRMHEFNAGVGDEALSFGIGVNTGNALAGNVGGKERMEYTLIGDAVNVSKRLQENARGGQILLGASTYALVRDFVQVNEIGPIAIKGRNVSEKVYELVGVDE